MNEEIILQLVAPHVKNGAVTYTCFDSLFSMLSRKEQYVVCELLYKNGVMLVDEPDQETNVTEHELVFDAADEPNGEEDELGVEGADTVGLFDALKDPAAASKDVFVLSAKDIKATNETLVHLIQEGYMQAKQDLCVKNEKLVRKYANKYHKYYGNDLDEEDLMQAGFIGLLSAAEKYKFEENTAFTTYAVFWVKQSIIREIMDRGFRIRIPVHVMEKVIRAVSIDKKNSHLPFDKRMDAIAHEMESTRDRVEELLVINEQFLRGTSLDTPVGEEEETELGSFIEADKDLYDVETICLTNDRARMLQKAISTLSEREQDIINLRFGFADGHPHTLEDVGKRYGVTRERIRQIEAKALRKLKHPTRKRYYDG